MFPNKPYVKSRGCDPSGLVVPIMPLLPAVEVGRDTRRVVGPGHGHGARARLLADLRHQCQQDTPDRMECLREILSEYKRKPMIPAVLGVPARSGPWQDSCIPAHAHKDWLDLRIASALRTFAAS
jgi:hypothetical protein